VKVKPAVALVALLLDAASLYAESLCLQCHYAASRELKKCIEAAISKEDKLSCQKKQEAKERVCEDGECKIERAAQGGSQNESASKNAPEDSEGKEVMRTPATVIGP